jgi:sugar lactone lactonase YvrE
MSLRKVILQVYSGNEPYGFNDFVRGTLRLFNYAIDHNIDVKINIIGAEFEPYMIVENYKYNSDIIKPKIYDMNINQVLLINDLDIFMTTTEHIFVVTSNVWLNRSDIYNMSYLAFDNLINFKDYLFTAANQKVTDNLLYRQNGLSDNLLYGYTIIYVNKGDFKFKYNKRNILSLANQIRKNINLNKDTIVFSNSIQLQKILSQYIEVNSAADKAMDDSDIDIGIVEHYPTVQNILIDYIILMKSRKIYRFTDTSVKNFCNPRYDTRNDILTDVYETALDINTIIGNLEITVIPLYYTTFTIVGYAGIVFPARLSLKTLTYTDVYGYSISQGLISQPGVIEDSSGNFISQLDNPSGIAMDLFGNLYIADTGNHRICMVDTSGNFTTYAGSENGISGYLDGNSSTALFNSPTAIVVDKFGRIIVADTGNNAIRIIENDDNSDSLEHITLDNKFVNTLVGRGSTLLPSALGQSNLLNSPQGIAIDLLGNLFISDTGNHRICQITSGGKLVTIAGSTTLDSTFRYVSGFLNGKGTGASFKSPTALVVDRIGNIFVADTGNNVIRRITKSGNVTTVAGSGQPFFKEGRREQASFNRPTGIAVDLQNILYVSDTGNNLIRRINTDGDVSIIVGSPNQKSGAIDGYGSIDPRGVSVPFNKRATFNGPTALLINPLKQLIIADTSNNTIRRIDTVFSNPTKINPIPIQSIKVSHIAGIGLTLGPSLSAETANPVNVIYGHRRGYR